jgi:hypothetical protein
MFAMILSVLVLDDPQGFMYFPPEVYHGYESISEPRPLKQDTPFMLKYEWKFSRDEVAVSDLAVEPSNYEQWNQSSATHSFPAPSMDLKVLLQSLSRRDFTNAHEHRLWSHTVLTNWAQFINDSSTHCTIYYRILREPDFRNTDYVGAVAYLPHIQVQAKTVVELEAKLLGRYIEYTRYIEHMLQPIFDTTELPFAF